MARDRSPPRRGGYKRDYRDDRRDHRDDRHYRGSHRNRDRDVDKRTSNRDPGRLTPPGARDVLQRRDDNGRLSRSPPPRRDRSRDRKRERSPERERNGRYRSRERLRDPRSYRDDSREHKRLRRSPSVERRRRDDSRERRQVRDHRDEQLDPAKEAEDEEARRQAADQRKKLDRQARLVEWRKKKEAELAAAKAAASRPPTSDSGVPSPAAAASPIAPSVDTTAADSRASSEAPDKPFAGKFDPKAIARRAAAAKSRLENSTLGQDAAILGKPAPTNGPIAVGAKKSQANGQNGGAKKAASAQSKGIKTEFGISASAEDTGDGVQSGPAIDMGDDEAKRRKLAMMPEAELDDGDVEMDQGDEDEQDVADYTGEGTEEEQAAVRAAAEKRAIAAATEKQLVQPTAPAQPVSAHAEGEEIDPLDAYMEEMQSDTLLNRKKKKNNKLLEAELYSDDEVREAVGDDDDLLAQNPKKKKKELPIVDHSKIKYEAFRKSFFTEPVELKGMSDQDVSSLRFELDDIKVQGSNVPKPVQKFAQFGLGTQVLDIIRELGFQKPTSIQAQAIPAIMSGRDVIGVAKTGSGKTVAFLLPMFRHIKDQRPLESMEGPIGLIMAPTRELATQIHRECKPYLKALQLRAVCAYGGSPITEQIADLKRGAEVVVCTPGRLIDLLSANSGRVINLKRVTYVVMDEADRMFDMGFEPQITRVMNNIRPDRQTVLFSATFPRKMEGLARKELRKPVQITVGGRSTVPKEITQIIEILDEDKKLPKLLQLIGKETELDEDKRVLVFVERQETADTLLGKLQRAGYPCASVHGGREQIDRDEAIQDFKAGNIPVMIATSVAARGLDVKQLTLVVNYDVPSHLEDYVHRAGRTGRAGNLGTAVTFLTPDQERYSLDILKALTQSDTPVPESLQKMADEFQRKIKEGMATRYGSGFGGHGLEKISAQHDAELARQRRAFAPETQPTEEEKEKEKDKDGEPPHEDEIKVFAKGEAQPVAPQKQPTAVDAELASEIKVNKTEKAAPVPQDPKKSRLDRAAAMAAAINSRLGAQGTTRAGASIDNRGPDAGEFHYKLEINDFPQRARWAVTNRTNVAKILESTGVSITTKGQYYPAGQEPEPGALPKMNVLVEGDTEPQVISAVQELRRLLKEAVAASNESADVRPGGRYTVV